MYARPIGVKLKELNIICQPRDIIASDGSCADHYSVRGIIGGWWLVAAGSSGLSNARRLLEFCRFSRFLPPNEIDPILSHLLAFWPRARSRNLFRMKWTP
jgi:hypothetical protein